MGPGTGQAQTVNATSMGMGAVGLLCRSPEKGQIFWRTTALNQLLLASETDPVQITKPTDTVRFRCAGICLGPMCLFSSGRYRCAACPLSAPAAQACLLTFAFAAPRVSIRLLQAVSTVPSSQDSESNQTIYLNIEGSERI